ncbi:PREDICTED: beta-1,3-glucan-binding protein 1-like [Polistes canadensis]|uniref:beta-1,3-glucan-binding protein 1-like n=1 Tax=Polistes canadensis TaxID=91411 RepID=UPI000718D116|nr:PREDICTED: beta-1,3-glucan-binding protein 1-like [Polistes canadensis]
MFLNFNHYRSILFCLIALLININISFAYSPPSATVEPLYPKGLRISVPHEQGITLVAYHVKFNDDFYSLEAGVISIDIIKPRNGRWVYEDHTTELKEGDIIYFWVHVVYQGLGYNLLNQEHRVTGFFNYDGTPRGSSKEGNCDKPSITKVFDRNGNSLKVCTNQLIFEDGFDSLNTSIWTVLEQFSGAPDFEFVVYNKDNNNVKIQNQQLVITPTFLDGKYSADFVRQGSLELQRCTSTPGSDDCKREAFAANVLPPILSGRLNTNNSFTFQYGRIEVRAKLPAGDWIYPIISLEVANKNKQEEWTQPVIRIASASGNSHLRSVHSTDLSGHVLSAGGLKSLPVSEGPYASRSELLHRSMNSLWSDDFHVYEIEWRDDRILAKFDNTIFGEQRIDNTFDQPFFLTLGLAVGGYGEFPDMSRSNNIEKPWKNQGSKAVLNFYEARDQWAKTWEQGKTSLKIDYVKVWAL